MYDDVYLLVIKITTPKDNTRVMLGFEVMLPLLPLLFLLFPQPYILRPKFYPKDLVVFLKIIHSLSQRPPTFMQNH